ncbi:MAG: serine protease [Pseudomonadota bacterium]
MGTSPRKRSASWFQRAVLIVFAGIVIRDILLSENFPGSGGGYRRPPSIQDEIQPRPPSWPGAEGWPRAPAGTRRPPILPEPSPSQSDPASSRPALPAPNANDLVVDIGEPQGPKRNSIGTAFAITDDGIWMTAAHVVKGCNSVGLLVDDKKVIRADAVLTHPTADAALIRARLNAPPLAFLDDLPRIGETGYQFGFPQGRPAAVAASVLGRAVIRTKNGRNRELAIAWAERARFPEFPGTLGGISGGPILNGEGEIVGINVAASIRRGRVYTAAPRVMSETLEVGRVTPNGRERFQVSNRNVAYVESSLRKRRSVRLVHCLVQPKTRNPRRPRRR